MKKSRLENQRQNAIPILHVQLISIRWQDMCVRGAYGGDWAKLGVWGGMWGWGLYRKYVCSVKRSVRWVGRVCTCVCTPSQSWTQWRAIVAPALPEPERQIGNGGLYPRPLPPAPNKPPGCLRARTLESDLVSNPNPKLAAGSWASFSTSWHRFLLCKIKTLLGIHKGLSTGLTQSRHSISGNKRS